MTQVAAGLTDLAREINAEATAASHDSGPLAAQVSMARQYLAVTESRTDDPRRVLAEYSLDQVASGAAYRGVVRNGATALHGAPAETYFQAYNTALALLDEPGAPESDMGREAAGVIEAVESHAAYKGVTEGQLGALRNNSLLGRQQAALKGVYVPEVAGTTATAATRPAAAPAREPGAVVLLKL